MIGEQLKDTQAAFDSVAAEYDGPLGNNELVQWMRARTLDAVTRSVSPNATLLDLGCGTGLDAVALAQQGYRLTAIDWSAEMVRRTRQRATDAGVDGVMRIHHLGVQELEQLTPGEFDAAYSDLGSLNCVPDLARCARSIAARVRPGGALVASVIGRVCVWELAVFAAKRQWRRARLRAATTTVPVPLNGHTVWTSYYTPSEFRSAFERAGFRLHSLRALGLLSPPPYLFAFAKRHPGLIATLQALEDRLAAWPGVRQWGDHFLIVMQRHG
jgi:2-polyprenyl-3-methyl-5-hydroxy-6-metoxy-1,4-benzoquinol methylase